MDDKLIKTIDKETKIFNNLAKDLKELENKKQTISKEEYKRTFEITINEANKKYRQTRTKTPCKKNHI